MTITSATSPRASRSAAWRAIQVIDVQLRGRADQCVDRAAILGSRRQSALIVTLVVRQTRVTMDDGPDWGAMAVATSVALTTDGGLSVVLQDRWSDLL